MGTSVGGLVTGIDSKTLINQLIEADSQPITLLNQTKSKIQRQADAYSSISSALTALQSAAKALQTAGSMVSFKASSSNADVATVTADATAVPGTFSLSVSQLAQSQRQVSAEGYKSLTDAKFGTGDIIISDGVTTKKVPIQTKANTLSGIMNAINTSGANVTATIMNDGSSSPYRLVITGKDTENYTVDMSGLVPQDGEVEPYANPTFPHDGSTYREGKKAAFTVNGVEITRNTNTINDVIPGVTMQLAKDGGAASTITIATDTTATAQKIQSFVSAYNSAMSLITQNTSYNTTTKTAGILASNSTVLTIKSKLQSLAGKPATGVAKAFSLLSQIGITTNRSNGTLDVDSAKLNSALAGNFTEVVNLFTAKPTGKDDITGAANRFYDAIDLLTKTGTGLIPSQIKNLNKKMSLIDDQVTQRQEKLDKQREILTRQFSNLESTISRMQNANTAMVAQFDALNTK